MRVTIVKCDWCKTETTSFFCLPFNGSEYDICPKCREEIELRLAGPVAPVPAAPKAKAKAAKAKEEPAESQSVFMASHSGALAKALGLDMRLADQAALHEGVIRDHEGIEYPSLESMTSVYRDAVASRPILFQGELPHHKEILKGLLETYGVDFGTLDGRKAASEMKAALELHGISLDALPEYVEKHVNVGF